MRRKWTLYDGGGPSHPLVEKGNGDTDTTLREVHKGKKGETPILSTTSNRSSNCILEEDERGN